MKYLTRLAGYYRSLAIVLLSTVVVFICLNVILWAAFAVKDSRVKSGDPVTQRYGNANLESVYPGLSRQEIEQILNETWGRPLVYEPFTQFKEGPCQGRYVNVDPSGFRVSKNQGAWPPDSHNYNIFLFGGSTLFGYCVADDQTIPSHLQDFLWGRGKRKVRVYNFARGFYYSTQERILFEELLRAGFKPDVAIFVDGLNEFYFVEDQPALTSRLGESVRARNVKRTIGSRLAELMRENDLPINRLAKGLRSKIARTVVDDAGAVKREGDRATSGDEHVAGDEATIGAIVSRYMENKKLIETVAEGYGVATVFVWQPVPTYGYDLRHHLLSEWCLNRLATSRHGLSGPGYTYMAQRLDQFALGDNFLWLADIQRDKQEPLYVDIIHYSGPMCDTIGRAIGEFVLRLHLAAHVRS